MGESDFLPQRRKARKVSEFVFPNLAPLREIFLMLPRFENYLADDLILLDDAVCFGDFA